MKFIVSTVSFFSLSLATYPASVYGGTLRALSDEDLTKKSRPLSPPMYAWEKIGNDIDGEIGSESGTGVSLNADGSRLAVGAPRGGGTSPELWGPGEVTIYERRANNSWVQLGSDIEGNSAKEYSGLSVSLSGSGNRVAIGGKGQVRVYDYEGGDWVQYGQDIHGSYSDGLGAKVRLSQDGARLIAGADFYARVLGDINGNWVEIGEDIDDVSGSGSGMAISANGERVAVGSKWDDGFKGNTRIFELVDTNWIQVGQDIDGEDGYTFSGYDIDLNDDGTRIIVGVHSASTSSGENSGKAQVFDEVDGIWAQVGGDIDGEDSYDYFGRSVGITDDGSRVAIASAYNDDGGERAGHVRVFDIVNNVWVQTGQDLDGEDDYNYIQRVALSADGSNVAFGAPGNDGEGIVIGADDDNDDYYDDWYNNDDDWEYSYYGGHVQVFEVFEQCTDSPLPFDFQSFQSVDCEDVSSNQDACDVSIIASHCPHVCRSCGGYKCSDSEATLLYQGQKGTCELLKSIEPDEASMLCSRTDIKQTCRETCGFCYYSLPPSFSPSVSLSPSTELPSSLPSVSCPGSKVVIDLTTDRFADDTAWTIKDGESNIVAENEGLYNRDTTSTRVCLPTKNDCYMFEITDSYGDGVCCSFGRGEYTVTFDGTVILTGGTFTDSESVDFCVETLN